MIQFDYKKSTPKQPGKLIIRCSDTELFENIREHFSVENTGARFARRYARFAPRRKYVITPTGTCELGLYWEVRQYLIAKQINAPVEISPALAKALKVGLDAEMVHDFKFTLRNYQEEVIKKAIKLGTGTCVLGTGAGKTFTTAALIEQFYKASNDPDTFKCLMLVPDLGLVTQTFDEFINVGINYKCTKWTGKTKPDFTSNVIIANIGIIQSRFEDNDWLRHIDLLVVDECHKITAGNKISKIVQQIKTPNKFGFTGTLPEDQLNKWSIIGKLGPVIYEKTSAELRNEDFLANVAVKILNIGYGSAAPHFSGPSGYRDELEYIYESERRNDLLTKLVDKLQNNTLVLVNHIAHGEAIEEYFTKLEGKQVYFIRGSVDVEERERIKKIMEDEHNVVCIAISAIFSTGVNVKNIHNIIFAAGGKSFIRTVQSIGRGLRKHAAKEKLIIFDLCDQLKYGQAHCDKRKTIYDKEKIHYKEIDIK
ncbi:MAG: DEAD/DEAH box helicase family protein [Deltaproteobacteria bacterium]|jgi:superfamily II DNA or RNA helicase|nr:DEAD/DEAH box helicase family protein [Deltaproteobacteria bacterium]